MSKPAHIIQCQVFDLILPKERGAYALQNFISQEYQQKVLPQLAEYLDEKIPTDQVIRVDRLELDLGQISLEGFEERLLTALKSALEGRIAEANTSSAPAHVRQQCSADNWMEALHFYLQTGTLPWWAKLEPNQRLESILFEHLPQWSKGAESALKTQLQKAAIGDIQKLQALNEMELLAYLQLQTQQTAAVPLRRLLAQFSDSWVEFLLRQLYKVSLAYLQELRSWVQAFLQRGTSSAQVQNPILHWVLIIKLLDFPGLKKILEQAQSKTIILDKTADSETHQPKPLLELSPDIKPIETSTETVEAESEEVAKAALPARIPKQQVLSPAKKTITPRTEDSFYIANAGLVLLAPYLGNFFETLGLIENKQFKSETAQQRAIHLLQFLAQGTWDNPEYELVLNKILCAWPLAETLPQSIETTELEQNEAESLLKAVIQNWPVLKNTSITGLRESFLQRKGKLSFQEKNLSWLLQVEPQPYDVLLNQLPWGYAMIKLSWMPHLLRVEWV